jgi:hypothetical protein
LAHVATAEGAIAWRVTGPPRIPERGELVYSADLERAIAALQERYVAGATLEAIAEWANEQDLLFDPADVRRVARLLAHPRGQAVYRVPSRQLPPGHPPMFRRAFPRFTVGRLWNATQRKLSGLAYRDDQVWHAGPRQPIGLFHPAVPIRCGRCGASARWSDSGHGDRIECSSRRSREPCLTSTRGAKVIDRRLIGWLADKLRDRRSMMSLYEQGCQSAGIVVPPPPRLWEEVPQAQIPRGAAPSESATPPVAPNPSLCAWLAELKALASADLNPVQRARSARLLERRQAPHVRARRIQKLPSAERFLRSAEVVAEQLERGQISPARLTGVLRSLTVEEIDLPDERRGWRAAVEWDPRAVLLLIDPAAWSVGLPGAEVRLEQDTVIIDGAPQRETVRHQVLYLYSKKQTQRQIAGLLQVSQSSIAQILDRAERSPQPPPAPGSPEHREKTRAESLAELLLQRSAADTRIEPEFAAWTAGGDRVRQALFRRMLRNVKSGGAPRPEKIPATFHQLLAAGDDPELDLSDAERPASHAEWLARQVDTRGSRSGEPPAGNDLRLVPMRRSHSLVPDRFIDPASLDRWARLGLDHIPRRTDLGPLAGFDPDYPWQAAIRCFLEGRPVPGGVGDAAPTVRDAIRVLEDYERGRVAVACPLGGALWLRGKQDAETALVEARLSAGVSSRMLEGLLGYPARWFDVYRLLLFTSPPRVVSWPALRGSGLSPSETFRHLLLNVAQSGAERLERFITTLVQHGHLRGGQHFQRPVPVIGNAEAAVYEVLYQACWLTPTDQNEQAVRQCVDRLNAGALARRRRAERDAAKAKRGVDLAESLAALRRTLGPHLPGDASDVGAATAPDSPSGPLSTGRPLLF